MDTREYKEMKAQAKVTEQGLRRSNSETSIKFYLVQTETVAQRNIRECLAKNQRVS